MLRMCDERLRTFEWIRLKGGKAEYWGRGGNGGGVRNVLMGGVDGVVPALLLQVLLDGCGDEQALGGGGGGGAGMSSR